MGRTSLLLMFSHRTLKRSRRPRPRPCRTPRPRARKTLGTLAPSGPRIVAPSKHSALRLPWLRNRSRTNTISSPRPLWAALSKIRRCPLSASTCAILRDPARRPYVVLRAGLCAITVLAIRAPLAPASPRSSRTQQPNGDAHSPHTCSYFASFAPVPTCRTPPTFASPDAACCTVCPATHSR